MCGKYKSAQKDCSQKTDFFFHFKEKDMKKKFHAVWHGLLGS